MKVYLYGKRGGKGNFKITTAMTYSSLDSLIEEALEKLTNFAIKGEDYYESNLLEYLKGYALPTIYWMDVDSKIPAKKVNNKMWQQAVHDYSQKNIDKIAKYELLKRGKRG